MKIEIIKYEESYAKEIVSMWRSSKKIAFGQEDIHDFKKNLKFLREVLSQENSIYLAIEQTSKKIIGMLAMSSEMISQLYVHVNYLKLGIGTKLLNLAKEKSSGKLELFTFQRNKVAKMFYEKNGFVEMGRNFKNELNLPDIKYQWIKNDK